MKAGRAVALVLLGAVLLGGPVRALTALPLGWATLLGACVGAGCVLLVNAPIITGATAVWAAVVGGLGVLAFAVGHSGPLAGWVGSDGGIHLSYRNEFAATEPHVYAGFVSFYAFTWCVERVFHTDASVSFAAGTLVVVFAVGAATACATQLGAAPARAPTGRIAAVIVSVVLLFGLALPIVGYYELDGFFAQLWVMVPLLLLWMVDRSGLSRGRRTLLFAILYVATRYTYGLVLGDLAVLAFVLVLVESRGLLRGGHAPRVSWCVLVLLALVGLVAFEWRFCRELFAVVERYGWFVRHDFAAVLQGCSIAVLGLAVVCVASPALGRMLLVPLTICATNTATLFWLTRRYPGPHYYLQKYDFHAVVLLCICAAAACAFVAGGGLRGRRVVVAALGTSLLVGGIARAAIGFEPMRTAFTQRLLGGAVRDSSSAGSMRVVPLVDRRATGRMRQVLVQEHAEFGGYLVPWGPGFNFVNALFWRWNGGYFAYRGLDRRPGRCVFWTHRRGTRTGLWDVPPWMKQELAGLDALPEARAEHYSVGGESRDLCHACWPASQP